MFVVYKLELDPTVRRHFPHSYRDFNYLVATGVMRALAYQVPQTAQALKHWRVVAAFGKGPERIEIRRIDGSLNRPAPRRPRCESAGTRRGSCRSANCGRGPRAGGSDRETGGTGTIRPCLTRSTHAAEQ